jgi:2-polyprenyl-6-methoxyphenol hydroxylase-like FAD-dependent oxidoreductase
MGRDLGRARAARQACAVNERILIAGAGPVGLTAALALHQAGVSVSVFEKRAALSPASRASTFHASTLDLLDRLGVLGGLLGQGRRIDRIGWFRAGAGPAALLDLALLEGHAKFPQRWHFEQAKLTPALLAALPPGTVRFNTEVLGATQHDDGVVLTLSDGSQVSGRAAIAADGAHSALRGAAGIGVESGTYGHRVLRLMTEAPLETFLHGAGVAYVFAGERSISLLHMKNVWRVIIRVPAGTADEAALQPEFWQPIVRAILPEAPDPLPIAGADVYGVAKGIAHRMREGKFFVVGDAAHVTNTRGGMNMNAGIHDAYTLAACLAGDSDLNAWARARERVTREHLLERTDRAVATGSAWLDQAVSVAKDPAQARTWLIEAAMLDTYLQGMPA